MKRAKPKPPRVAKPPAFTDLDGMRLKQQFETRKAQQALRKIKAQK